MSTAESADSPPFLRVRGPASAEDLAALTAVFTGLAALEVPQAGDPGGSAEGWGAPAGRVHRMPSPGQGAWRASGLPQ